MATDPKRLAETYFESWQAKDFDTFRSILADEATFTGPLGTADDADGCVRGIKGMSEMVTDIVVQKMVADDTDVLTWFELHTSAAPPCPTVNWSHVEGGKITQIRVTFDPRPLVDGK
jgi:hypothetical protein